MLYLGYALATLIGLSLGLLGGGGSILTVPIFVYVMGFDPKLAIVMSLPVVGITSAVGVLSHWRSGNVDLKTAVLFGVIAMAGAYAGARLSQFVSGAVQLSILAVVMLVAAIMMFRSARRPLSASGAAEERSMTLALLVPVALLVGVMTGFVGVGGGFLVVPALVLLARVPIQRAIGTSLLVIAMNCTSAYLGYVGRVEIPRGLVVNFTLFAIVGILIGTNLVRFVSQRALKQAFAVFLLVMGTFILAKNRNVFSNASAHRASTSPRVSASWNS